MTIENSTIADIDEIFRLYGIATEFMRSKKTVVVWPEFERSMVEEEIAKNRQWKLIIEGKIACVWATAYDDPQIWQDRNVDPSVYIHRIATNPEFRGYHWVKNIVKWAKKHAEEQEKKFIRMDTVGENMGLINHYKKCGFNFLGLLKLENTEGLPGHYHNATVSLFQIALEKK
jgi:hypothetical protein